MMIKIFAVVLAVMVMVGLSSCAKNDEEQGQAGETEVVKDVEAGEDGAEVESQAVEAAKVTAEEAESAAEEIEAAVVEEVKETAAENGLVELKIELPKAMFVGTPQDFRVENLESPSKTARPAFYAPAGTAVVSRGKKVYSTDDMPIIGELDLINDGDKSGDEGCYVELGPMIQHITFDLGQPYEIYAVLVWHFHMTARVYFDVIVQTADDLEFTQNVQTLYNNDIDNSAGQGVGTDMHYVETAEGRLIDGKGVKSRYVRLYSNGNTQNELNHYVEVEIFGKAVE